MPTPETIKTEADDMHALGYAFALDWILDPFEMRLCPDHQFVVQEINMMREVWAEYGASENYFTFVRFNPDDCLVEIRMREE